MKRFICIVCAAAIAFAFSGCTANDTKAESSNDGNTTASEQASSDDKSTEKEDPYEKGTHHAKAYIVGYGEIEIEIYSDTAPQTASTFCHLVEDGYYNCTEINYIMKGLYVSIAGNDEASDEEVEPIEGEFKEAGYTKNTLSLKSGVIAMGRVDDTKQSDPDKIVIFLGDSSYLDGQYAGFAKVTWGIKKVQEISDDVKDAENTDGTIKVKKDGTVKKKTRPMVRKIEMVD